MSISAGTEIGFQTPAGSAATIVVTLSAGADVGDLVVITIANAVGISGITDSSTGGPNTWTRTVNVSSDGFTGICIAWTIVSHALVATNTITATLSASNPSVAHVEKFTGADAAPLDQSQGHAAGSSTASVDSTNTSATTNADDMLFGAVGNQTTAAFTPAVVSPTWTATATEGQRNSQKLNQHFRNVGATNTYNYAGTLSPADYNTAGVIAFKATAAPPGPDPATIIQVTAPRLV